jgi:DNA-binding LytR/AlgR family response regulator
MSRLPAHLGRELVALEAEDHYLRVHTAAGSGLVLARLSDAIAQLQGTTDGLQVHRGWWVAADAVAGVRSADGRTSLQLRNGLHVPVSRTFLQPVRERGWRPA